MKTANVLKMMTGVLAAGLAWCAMADGSGINNVVVRQRWPWSRLVDIDYVLEGDPANKMDIQVTAKDGSVPLDLPPDSLSGHLHDVTPGPRRIIFDPTKTAYTNSQMLTQFSVTLQPAPVPLYMIVDLTKAVGADGQIEYVYPGDARLETYGRFTNVWFGVTNDVYKTDKLVLRRVSAGSFKMGSSAVNVTLTKPFYAGVFEMTQRQYERVMDLTAGTNPSYFNNPSCYAQRPVECCSYPDLRGSSNDTPSVNWPATGSYVKPTSVMGKLRSKTGISDFDLPTEAQWEYLCRAGTTTRFNDGDANANTEGDNGQTNQWMNALGRYQYNGGYCFRSNGTWWWPDQSCTESNGTAWVGTYLPNNWGIYDTHGNVWEWGLDYWKDSLSAATDPVGETAGSERVIRGGDWTGKPSQVASGARYHMDPANEQAWLGFRVVITLQ